MKYPQFAAVCGRNGINFMRRGSLCAVFAAGGLALGVCWDKVRDTPRNCGGWSERVAIDAAGTENDNLMLSFSKNITLSFPRGDRARRVPALYAWQDCGSGG